jgi:Xaa-Pro aminopeptidase
MLIFRKKRIMQYRLFPADTYVERRKRLAETLGKGEILFLGNEESSINFRDNWYPFRQDSTFLYYFGLSIPGLAAYLDTASGEAILFGNELGIDDIIWTGPLPSLKELGEQVGIKRIEPMGKLPDFANRNIHYLPPYRPEHSLKISELTKLSPKEVENGFSIRLIKAVVQQRSIKSKEEIRELHEAVSNTAAMHLAVMKAARPGMYEHELVAVAQKEAWSRHVPLSFPPIMTINGQVLHNHTYSNLLEEDRMILFDGGTESRAGYAGDMTRTFPVGKRFNSQQKELYQIVRKAHVAAADALKPGVPYREIHLLASRIIAEGLTELGLMKGDPEEAVKAGAHSLFFQHGLGHMMGLDVHDMENLGEDYVGYNDEIQRSKSFGLKSLRLGRALEPGFVLTVEPGIYMIPDLIDLRKAEGAFTDFVNYDKVDTYRKTGGIRIEEDFVITESGAELLGTPLPHSVEEVEALR